MNKITTWLPRIFLAVFGLILLFILFYISLFVSPAVLVGAGVVLGLAGLLIYRAWVELFVEGKGRLNRTPSLKWWLYHLLAIILLLGIFNFVIHPALLNYINSGQMVKNLTDQK